MIRSKSVEDRLRDGRLDAKTRDSLFRRKIEQGANCAPFVSKAILQTVKEVFPLDPEDLSNQLDLGRIRLLVVAAREPAGKALDECQKASVLGPSSTPVPRRPRTDGDRSSSLSCPQLHRRLSDHLRPSRCRDSS